eukprot:gene5063-biopygen12182
MGFQLQCQALAALVQAHPRTLPRDEIQRECILCSVAGRRELAPNPSARARGLLVSLRLAECLEAHLGRVAGPGPPNGARGARGGRGGRGGGEQQAELRCHRPPRRETVRSRIGFGGLGGFDPNPPNPPNPPNSYQNLTKPFEHLKPSSGPCNWNGNPLSKLHLGGRVTWNGGRYRVTRNEETAEVVKVTSTMPLGFRKKPSHPGPARPNTVTHRCASANTNEGTRRGFDDAPGKGQLHSPARPPA